MEQRYKIVERESWVPPEGGGAPLLTMANVPLPAHGLAPRTVMEPKAWTAMRKACYKDHDDICEICGVKLGSHRGEPNMHQAHEVYNLDYPSRTMAFDRVCCICPTCHQGIHSGRAITQYLNHAPLWTKEYILSIAQHVFSLIHKWNVEHPDNEPLRLYETYLDWLQEPSLREEMEELIRTFDIEFWMAPNRSEWENDWQGWKLVYDGVEYYGKYQDRKDWEEQMREANHQSDRNNLFSDESFAQLEDLGLW